jgi:hypothetical protein
VHIVHRHRAYKLYKPIGLLLLLPTPLSPLAINPQPQHEGEAVATDKADTDAKPRDAAPMW